jgi:hypothetical protein
MQPWHLRTRIGYNEAVKGNETLKIPIQISKNVL